MSAQVASSRTVHNSCCLPASVAGLLYCVVATGALGAASLTVDQRVFNFGAVTNVVLIQHEFRLHNSGDAELQILRVVSGCDACLQASVERTKSPPGGDARLHCQLNTRLFSGATSRSVTVHSTDLLHPVIELELTGNVVPAYRLDPPEIHILDFPAQTTETVEITPLLPLRAPLSVATCDSSNLTVRLATGNNGQFTLTIQALSSLPRGRFPLAVTVRSADSNDLPCRIQGSVYYAPEFEVLPAQLVLEPRSAPQLRILWLKQHSATPLTLLDVIAPSRDFHCEIDPDPVSPDYRIYVTVASQTAAAGQTRELILKTRTATGQERLIHVPITVKAEP